MAASSWTIKIGTCVTSRVCGDARSKSIKAQQKDHSRHCILFVYSCNCSLTRDEDALHWCFVPVPRRTLNHPRILFAHPPEASRSTRKHALAMETGSRLETGPDSSILVTESVPSPRNHCTKDRVRPRCIIQPPREAIERPLLPKTLLAVRNFRPPSAMPFWNAAGPHMGLSESANLHFLSSGNWPDSILNSLAFRGVSVGRFP